LLAGPLGKFCDPRKSRQAACGPPAAEASFAAAQATDTVPTDGVGFAQPHITGAARAIRDGVLGRRDHGHDPRGR